MLVPDYSSMQLSETAKKVVFLRRENALESCMRKRGFAYTPATYIALPTTLARGERRWGPLESSVASTQGYHFSVGSTVDKQPPPAVNGSAAERNAYALALTGVPDSATRPPDATEATLPGGGQVAVQMGYLPGSCASQVAEKLYGSINQSTLIYQALQQKASELEQAADAKAAGSNAFKKAIKSWAKCFKDKGFDAADPLSAVQKYYSDSDTPTANEISVAKVDVDCKTKSALWATWQTSLASAWQDVA
ncbi:MAG: hypothetical protein H0X25_20915, partial [Acidobacteriales bacterium]|nr:hypothetical protein [Terriglobales bacterium]